MAMRMPRGARSGAKPSTRFRSAALPRPRLAYEGMGMDREPAAGADPGLDRDRIGDVQDYAMGVDARSDQPGHHRVEMAVSSTSWRTASTRVSGWGSLYATG